MVKIIDSIAEINIKNAEKIAATVKPEAEQIYNRAWERWESEAESTQRSPLNMGFSVISSQIWKRAKALEGEAALDYVEEDGETEVYLTEKWSRVQSAFIYAAMAKGVPQYVPDHEKQTLTEAWKLIERSTKSGDQ